MDAIEKRARELLAAEYAKGQFRAYAAEIRDGTTVAFDEEIRAIVAIITALTPPEGYVLVPVDLSTLQRYDLRTVHFYGDEKEDIVECSGGPYVCLSDVQAMLAARPEVP